MPAPEHPGDLLRAYGLQAKKRFGQHFLSDPVLLRRIADAAGVERGSRVLEIGPGCGTLTLTLLQAGASVTAVELDDDAFAFLRDHLAPSHPALNLVHGDALQVSLEPMIAEPGWLAVANLPYNVATPILFRLLELGTDRPGRGPEDFAATEARGPEDFAGTEARGPEHFAGMEPPPFRRLALMFQKEVAERICAAPGTKQFGALSLNVRLFATGRVAFKLKPGAFSPPPAVDSAVVVLEPIEGMAISDPALRQVYREVVAAAFAQRRKTIRNSMQSRWPTDAVEGWLAQAGIDPRVRAEKLGFEEFAELARVVSAGDGV